MYIIEDTRQKKTQHILKNEMWANAGDTVIRSQLPFGDYASPPRISIDTKWELDEICTNLCSTTAEHNRVRAECKLAQDCGSKLIFLIENTYGIKNIDDVHEWINPRTLTNPRCSNGDRLEKVMKTMRSKYGCEFLFCQPEETSEVIKSLLGAENGKQ